MEWSQEKTIQFIKCYKSYSILWDCKHELYKNKVQRHNALQEIAAKFETQKVEIERKIKNLQSHFLREHKRLEHKKKGFRHNGILVSKWFAYKSLLFLSSRNKPSKPFRLNLDSHVTTDNENSGSAGRSSSPFNLDEPKQEPPSDNEPEEKEKEVVLVSPKMLEKSPLVAKSMDKLEPLSNNIGEDEFDTFGRHVANQLRNLPLPNAIMSQNFINNHLAEERLKVLGAQHFYDSNPLS